MKAAERLFKTRRFHEITVEQIAEAAAVGKGTVYLYFKDKEDIFFHTATSGFDELCDLIRSKLDSSQTVQDRLLHACESIGEFFGRRRSMFRMMQVEEARLIGKQTLGEKWRSRRKALIQVLAELIEDGVRAGQIRGDIPSHELATFLLGLLRCRARDLCDAPESVRRYDTILNFFLNGANLQ